MTSIVQVITKGVTRPILSLFAITTALFSLSETRRREPGCWRFRGKRSKDRTQSTARKIAAATKSVSRPWESTSKSTLRTERVLQFLSWSPPPPLLHHWYRRIVTKNERPLLHAGVESGRGTPSRCGRSSPSRTRCANWRGKSGRTSWPCLTSPPRWDERETHTHCDLTFARRNHCSTASVRRTYYNIHTDTVYRRFATIAKYIKHNECVSNAANCLDFAPSPRPSTPHPPPSRSRMNRVQSTIIIPLHCPNFNFFASSNGF